MITNEELAKQVLQQLKFGEAITPLANDRIYDASLVTAMRKDEQYLENVEDDAKSYVNGVAKANPDLSEWVLNFMETAYIAGRNKIK